MFNSELTPSQIKNTFVKTGKIHRKVIQDILPQLRENQPLIDIAKIIENSIHQHTKFENSTEFLKIIEKE